MAGIMGRLAEEAKSMASEAGVSVYADGYNEAAHIVVSLVDQKITEFQKRAASGDFLSEREQFLSGKLHELKAEMEKELRDFWERGGPRARVDERP